MRRLAGTPDRCAAISSTMLRHRSRIKSRRRRGHTAGGGGGGEEESRAGGEEMMWGAGVVEERVVDGEGVNGMGDKRCREGAEIANGVKKRD